MLTYIYVYNDLVLCVKVAVYQRKQIIFLLWELAHFTKHNDIQWAPFC